MAISSMASLTMATSTIMLDYLDIGTKVYYLACEVLVCSHRIGCVVVRSLPEVDTSQ